MEFYLIFYEIQENNNFLDSFFSYSDEGIGAHNYCRNPETRAPEASPWCYNSASSFYYWDYCTIPSCSQSGELRNAFKITHLFVLIYIAAAQDKIFKIIGTPL